MKKKWYKKWWVWVIAIVVLACIGAATSTNKENTAFTNPATPTVNNTATMSSTSSRNPSSASANPSDKNVLTIEEFAKENSAPVGQLNKIYTYETSEKGADGINPKLDGLSIQSVSKSDSFNVGNKTLKNVISLEFTGDYASVTEFLKNKAFVITGDPQGNTNSGFSSSIFKDNNTGKEYMLFYSDSSITKDTFVLLGGFSKNTGSQVPAVVFALN